MNNNIDKAFKHAIKNKQIVLSSIILGLAVVFIFSLEEQGNAKVSTEPLQKEEFVVQEQENITQPIDFRPEQYAQTDSIIYEKSMGERVACEGNETGSAVTVTDDIGQRKVDVPVLMYHYIEAAGSTTLPWLYEPPEIFEKQLKTLYNKCYNSIFVSDLGKSIADGSQLPVKSIALTFDDGYEDMYTNAFPLLKKYDMKGTMYIIVNALDKPGYLTKEQVKEMADSGYVEIAAHTLNHPDLRHKDWQVANYEIGGSKRELENIIGKPVTDFAYPYGFFTVRDEEICRQAGYLTCASTYPGQVQTYAERFSLYRLRPGFRVGSALLSWLELAGPKR
ncbi:MAG: polysaccharide deacetylase family protein [Candidatus Buchananbacteria bacterium]